VVKIKLGEAFVEMSAKDTQLVKDLGNAQSKVSKSADAMAQKLAGIGKGMAIAGAAITAAFGVIIKKTMDAGDQFDKMSLRTGISVETLSSLAYAADITGTSIEGMEIGLKFLTKGMDDASKGTGEAKDAFEELGISITDTEGNLRPTIDVMKEAATKIAAIENPTKQAALAMELFGARSGTQLIPLLKEGGAGIEELMNKAKELGITMSTKSASAAAEFKDRLTDLQGSLAGAGRTIGDTLIPAITPLIEKVVEIIGRIKAWAEENKPLVETIVKFLAAAGGIMVVLGPILMMLPALVTAFSGLGVVIAAICSPIGLIVAAAIALYLAWKENWGGIHDFTNKVMEKLKPSLDWLSDKLDKIKEGVREFGKWLGIIEEDLAGGGGAVGAFGDEIASVADQIKEKLGGTIEELKKIADLEIIFRPAEEAIQNLIDSMNEYELEIKAVNDRYDEAIEKIKTYITDEEELKVAIDRLNEGRKAEITLLEKEQTGLEKMAEAKQKLVDLTKSLTDKIYEFTHTEYEVTLRDINREYDLLVENAKEVFASEKELAEAIKIINGERQKEIDVLKESNKVKDETIDKNKELASSSKEAAIAAKDTGEALEEAGEKGAKAGEIGKNSWEDFSIIIKKATVSLSSFTQEAVATAIASIKMKFAERWGEINRYLQEAGRYSYIIRAQYDESLKTMNEQIKVVLYGYTEYAKIMAQLSGESPGAFKPPAIPSYQTGTRYVPKTSLAVVHKGEEINPPGQRSYDQRKSYSSTSSINIMPGAINIITPKFSEADGQDMFRIIERQAKMRGLGLVRT